MESPERHEERIQETEEKVKGAKDHGGGIPFSKTCNLFVVGL
jgi:hypothetical protein